VADLFILDAQQRCFAETAQSGERSLGLDKMAFGQVLGTIGAMIPETEAIFDCEPLAKQHPELILEQAREVLMLRSLHALREINTLRAVAETSSSRTLELEEETRRDALTGVYNRAHLDHVLAREFENASRHKWPLSIAFADLDSFKGINDRFGHQAGDRILQATARILRGNTRENGLARALRRRGIRRGVACHRRGYCAVRLRADRRRISQHGTHDGLRSSDRDHLDRVRHTWRTHLVREHRRLHQRADQALYTANCAGGIARSLTIGKFPARWRRDSVKSHTT